MLLPGEPILLSGPGLVPGDGQLPRKQGSPGSPLDWDGLRPPRTALLLHQPTVPMAQGWGTSALSLLCSVLSHHGLLMLVVFAAEPKASMSSTLSSKCPEVGGPVTIPGEGPAQEAQRSWDALQGKQPAPHRAGTEQRPQALGSPIWKVFTP